MILESFDTGLVFQIDVCINAGMQRGPFPGDLAFLDVHVQLLMGPRERIWSLTER
jgi:hypothetical protein